ncbi:MAG: hypothetical protein WD648_05615 [Planctomycetaceae bacterium]
MWKRAANRLNPHEDIPPRSGGEQFALTMLEDLQQSYTGDADPLLERLYNQLTIAHGIYKTTRRGRFCELDRVLLDDVRRRFVGIDTLRVHDLAASNGISSFELFNAIRAHRAVDFQFSDLYDRLFVVRAPESQWDVVFDSSGAALQYVGRGFALCAKRGESRRYPINCLLKRMLDYSLLPRAAEILAQARSPAGRLAAGRVRDVLLLHPECVRAQQDHSNLMFRRHDLFMPLAEQYHLVRAMNILNRGYFNDERIVAGVRACLQGLTEGGMLVVGRTIEEEDGRTRASAFIRSDHAMQCVWDFNEGAEIKGLVEGVCL